MKIHVFPDRGSRELEVCEKFDAQHHLTWAHSYHGNSANVMEALKWSTSQRADLIYIIEDDAIIEPDFFQWCREAISKRLEAFAACGWSYSPDALPAGDGPDLVIPWYLSVATCLPRRSVSSIAAHACLDYYSDMKGYLDRVYPASNRRGSMHYEQDGLALRVSEAQSRMCLWPRRPRAKHIGFRGYHMDKGASLPGSLQERVSLLRLIVENPSLLGSLMAGGPPPAIARCCTCNKPLVTVCEQAIIRCVECFHSEFPHLPKTSQSAYYLGNLQEITDPGVSGAIAS